MLRLQDGARLYKATDADITEARKSLDNREAWALSDAELTKRIESHLSAWGLTLPERGSKPLADPGNAERFGGLLDAMGLDSTKLVRLVGTGKAKERAGMAPATLRRVVVALAELWQASAEREFEEVNHERRVPVVLNEGEWDCHGEPSGFGLFIHPDWDGDRGFDPPSYERVQGPSSDALRCAELYRVVLLDPGNDIQRENEARAALKRAWCIAGAAGILSTMEPSAMDAALGALRGIRNTYGSQPSDVPLDGLGDAAKAAGDLLRGSLSGREAEAREVVRRIAEEVAHVTRVFPERIDQK